MMTDNAALDAVLARLHGVRAHQGYWMARCPAHDDKNPSLSVGLGKQGNVLLKCHAGCDFKDVVRALGLQVHELWDCPEAVRTPRKIVDTYVYRDEEDRPLYEKVRYEPKDFRIRRYVPRDDCPWEFEKEWGLPKECRRVLFNLPELIASSNMDAIVVLVEGEKDVRSLARLQIVATTAPEGAGKWREEFADSLLHRRVLVVPDADTAGADMARHAWPSLEARCRALLMCPLRKAEQGKDITDWLKSVPNGARTKDEVVRFLLELGRAWAEAKVQKLYRSLSAFGKGA